MGETGTIYFYTPTHRAVCHFNKSLRSKCKPTLRHWETPGLGSPLFRSSSTFSVISCEWWSECSRSRNMRCCSLLASRHVSQVDRVQLLIPRQVRDMAAMYSERTASGRFTSARTNWKFRIPPIRPQMQHAENRIIWVREKSVRGKDSIETEYYSIIRIELAACGIQKVILFVFMSHKGAHSCLVQCLMYIFTCIRLSKKDSSMFFFKKYC